MRDVDKPENTTRVNPVGTGVAFPTTDLKVGDNMYWRNWNGGNEYILYYHGKTDTKAAGDIGADICRLPDETLSECAVVLDVR